MTMAAAYARLNAIAAATSLPGIETSMSYGTPSLKVKGRFLARLKDQETLVVRCPSHEKAVLIEAAPAIFFETDHYKGYDAVLVRMAAADDATIAARLRRAWDLQAPARLRSSVTAG